MKYVENYHIRLYINIRDSVATLSGEAGYRGLNPSGEGEPIRYDGIGRETMHAYSSPVLTPRERITFL